MESGKLFTIIDDILLKLPPFSVNMSLTSMNWVRSPEFVMKLIKVSAITDSILPKLPPFSVNMCVTLVNWVSFPEFIVKLIKLSVNIVIVA